MVARSIHISRSQSRLQKTLERFGWGAAKAGAVIGTAAIIGGPAWLGIAAGIGASITLGRIQELSQTKGKGFDSSAMADKMHLLVQNQLMPKLSSPRVRLNKSKILAEYEGENLFDLERIISGLFANEVSAFFQLRFCLSMLFDCQSISRETEW